MTQASNIVSAMITNTNTRNTAFDADMGQRLQTLVTTVTGADTTATSTTSTAAADYATGSAANDKLYLDGMAAGEKVYLTALADADRMKTLGGSAACTRDTAIEAAEQAYVDEINRILSEPNNPNLSAELVAAANAREAAIAAANSAYDGGWS